MNSRTYTITFQHILPRGKVRTKLEFRRKAAMLKPLIFSLTLTVLLCACTKKDDAVSNNNSATPPANAVGLSKDSAGSGANVPAEPPPARSESDSQATAKEAAVPTETQQNTHKKPERNAARDSAKATHSATARRWREFQAMVDRCDTTTGSAAEQCLKDAKDAYRSANFKCDTLAAPERANCLQFAETWNNAVADAPKAAVKHDNDPMMTPPSPGDPRPAERNRDSTKQQQDAVGNLPETKKPN